MVLLSRFFDWREALVIVKPETFLKWHRTAYRTFWRWKSRKRGRPGLPKNLRELIREMAHENPTWGEERIADELKLKLGIRVSPRTVRKYLNRQRPGGGSHDQDWNAFVRNQAKAIVACDFFISITLTFRVLYVFVAMEIGSRQILHCNVTDHPTAEWTAQQFREVLADVHPYRFVIHDHDSIFSPSLDLMLNDFGERVLKTPVQAPKANAFCERLVGTIRRECVELHHSDERTAPSPHSQRIRCILQSRSSSFRFRPWHARTDPGECSGLAAIGISFPPVTESARSRSSVDCIMIID